MGGSILDTTQNNMQLPQPNSAFRGHCNVGFPVFTSPAGAFMLSRCSGGAQVGTPLVAMHAACPQCPFRLQTGTGPMTIGGPVPLAQQPPQQVPQQPSSLPPAPMAAMMFSAPGAVVAAIQSPQPQPAPVIQFGPPPGAPPAPAPVPAPAPAPAPPPTSMAPVPQMQGAVPTFTFSPQMMSSVGLLPDTAGENLMESVEAVLAELSAEGGPSVGGLSWHTLEHTRCDRRTWYALCRGMVEREPGPALSFGTLFHACMEFYYKSGGDLNRTFLPCDMLLKRSAAAAEMAADVRTLIMAMLRTYAEDEAATWCPLAVEQQATFWLPAVKIAGAKRRIPITCRHDLLVHLRQPGGPVPVGPAPSVYVCDLKTTARLSYDLIKGYALDGQLMTNLVCYMLSGEVEKFGPLAGVIVKIAAKHAHPEPGKSFERVRDSVDDRALSFFYRDELMPMAYTLVEKLLGPNVSQGKEAWPMNRKECVGRFLCPYFNLCAFGETEYELSRYKVDSHRIIDVSNFLEPSKEWKAREKASASASTSTSGTSTTTAEGEAQSPATVDEAGQKRAQKAAIKKAAGDKVLAELLAHMRTNDWLQPRVFLIAGHTEKSVKAAVALALKEIFVLGTRMTWGVEDAATAVTSAERGLAWSARGTKSVITWTSMAEAIVHGKEIDGIDWWDPSMLNQNALPGSPEPATLPAPPAPPAPASAPREVAPQAAPEPPAAPAPALTTTFVPEWTGSTCSFCGDPQYTSPAGVTCSSGHIGASPKETTPAPTPEPTVVAPIEETEVPKDPNSKHPPCARSAAHAWNEKGLCEFCGYDPKLPPPFSGKVTTREIVVGGSKKTKK